MDIRAELGLSSGKYFASMVSIETLDEVWKEAIPVLEKGKAYWERYMSLDDMLDRIEGGMFQLWVIRNEDKKVMFVLISEILHYPKIKVLHLIVACGEKIEDVASYIDLPEIWGAQLGLEMCEVIGRPGWEKILTPRGYTKTTVTLIKDLKRMKEH